MLSDPPVTIRGTAVLSAGRRIQFMFGSPVVIGHRRWNMRQVVQHFHLFSVVFIALCCWWVSQSSAAAPHCSHVPAQELWGSIRAQLNVHLDISNASSAVWQRHWSFFWLLSDLHIANCDPREPRDALTSTQVSHLAEWAGIICLNLSTRRGRVRRQTLESRLGFQPRM